MFVVDGQPVSYCQYADKGNYQLIAEGPIELVDFVRKVLRRHIPAPCFVLDVAEIQTSEQTEFRVIELNSINSAGFYLCDIDKIVGQLSDYATSTNLHQVV